MAFVLKGAETQITAWITCGATVLTEARIRQTYKYCHTRCGFVMVEVRRTYLICDFELNNRNEASLMWNVFEICFLAEIKSFLRGMSFVIKAVSGMKLIFVGIFP